MSAEAKPRVKPEPKHRGRRYPWDEWFGKGSFTLKRGRDYVCLDSGMAMNARAAARAREIKLHITMGDGVLRIRVD